MKLSKLKWFEFDSTWAARTSREFLNFYRPKFFENFPKEKNSISLATFATANPANRKLKMSSIFLQITFS